MLLFLFLGGCQPLSSQHREKMEERKEISQDRKKKEEKQEKSSASEKHNNNRISQTEQSAVQSEEKQKDKAHFEKPECEEVKILATGDMIFHSPIIKSSKTAKGYDFTPIFEQVRSEIQNADISIANFEGAIDINRPLSKFPLFNFPKETVTSLKNVGFDVLSTANNHALDMKLEGLEQTHRLIREAGMLPVGTFVEGKRSPSIIEIKGIRIGFLAYTAPTNGMDAILTDHTRYQLNRLNDETVESDIKSLKSHCDYVIVMPHWGVEYSRIPNDMQNAFANKMFDWGADVILGSHPHVLEPAQIREINGERKFLIYSMGNGISNQREEILKKPGVNTGVFVKLTIEKNFVNHKTYLKDVQFEPTSILRQVKQGGGFQYRLINIKRYLQENPNLLKDSPNLVKKLQMEYEEGMKVLNGNNKM